MIFSGYGLVIITLSVLLAVGLNLVLLTERSMTIVYNRANKQRFDKMRLMAEALKIDPAVWLGCIILSPCVGIVLGLLWTLPVWMIGALSVTFGVGLPFLMEFRYLTILLRREGAVVALSKDLRDQIENGGQVGIRVRDLGRQPPALLRHCLPILADDERSMEERLGICATRSGSALMNRLCTYVMLGLRFDSSAFPALMRGTVCPYLEGLYRQRRLAHKVMSRQRGVITLMAAVLIVLVAVTYSSAEQYHKFYQTLPGAFELAGLILGFAGLTVLVRWVLREKHRPLWNVAALAHELEKRV